jgi:hypothetical protein
MVGDSLISWFSSAATPLTRAVVESRRSPKFGEEVDASALVLSQAGAALPVAVLTAFTPAGTHETAARWAEGTMEVTMPAGTGGVRVSCRFGEAPQVELGG